MTERQASEENCPPTNWSSAAAEIVNASTVYVMELGVDYTETGQVIIGSNGFEEATDAYSLVSGMGMYPSFLCCCNMCVAIAPVKTCKCTITY